MIMKFAIRFFILNLLFFKTIFSQNYLQEREFLIGQFEFSKHPDFINIKQIGVPVKRNDLFLQKEVAEQLLKLYQQLKKDLPNAEFWVTSATRNYWHQKQIWENKWNQYQKQYKNDPQQIATKILEYSSMPATSRHHWGTDFDINILDNSYYERGNGKMIYEWLKKNAKKYGFCMPYNENRNTGYRLEKWHWSYYKLAKIYQQKWNESFQNNLFDSKIDFIGKEFFKTYAPIYVNAINPECLE